MAETLTRRYLEHMLQDELGLSGEVDVLAHVDLPSLGDVEGGAETVVDALLACSGTLVMPAFTYQTQIIPQIGPPDNAIVYGTGDKVNAITVDFGAKDNGLRHQLNVILLYQLFGQTD